MRQKAITAALLGTVLVSCAGLNTRLPEISEPNLAAETRFQETEALEKLDADGVKLLDAGWPILTANAELCPKTRAAIGVKTHSLKSYSKRLRPAAERVLGATEIPRILHIGQNSPAAAAGFKRGDVILNDMNEPAELNTEGWNRLLSDNLVTVRRGEDNITLTVAPVMACNYALRLRNSTAINAYADGRNISVTTGMMDFTKNESELALIIGHELGHNTMGHIRKIVGNYILSFGATRYARPFESEADYVGMYYMVRAGYAPQGVEDFWQRLSTASPKGINLAKTHPTFPDRFLRIKAAREEILLKQQSGAPLIPNFINKAASSDS